MNNTPIQVQCPICGALHDEGPERGIFGVICESCRGRIERRIIIECPYDISECKLFRDLISCSDAKDPSDLFKGKLHARA